MKIGTKPNGIHFLDVQIPDPTTGELKRARVSCETRDMSEARRQKADWLAGVHPKHPAQGGVIAPKGQEPSRNRRPNHKDGMTLVRWLELCEDSLWRGCKAEATIRSNIKILSDVIDGDLMLRDVASTHVTAIMAALEERHDYAPASLKKLMGSLSAALQYATEQDDPETGLAYLKVKPRFPKIVVRNKRDRVLSEVEERALFECIDKRINDEPSRPWRQMGLLLTVMIDTGFRVGEALSLGPSSIRTKRWIDRTTQQPVEATYLGVERYHTKTDKPREVPATERVKRLLTTLNALAIKGRWFPWRSGSGGPGYLFRNLKEDMEEQGFDLSDVVLHTMRHTCATRLAVGGMDLLGLRDWLGHSDIKITADRYVHLMSSHLYQGAAILNLSAGTPSPAASNLMEDGAEAGMDNPHARVNDSAEHGTPAYH